MIPGVRNWFPDGVLELMIAGASSDASAADLPTQASADAAIRAHPAFPNVVLRARYTEDALHSAIRRGVNQYVILGAGFDSYALRVPSEYQDLQVFEIDHPATQALKQQSIAECDMQLTNSVHFLAADLAREELGDVLDRSAFDASQPAFFSWLGGNDVPDKGGQYGHIGGRRRLFCAGQRNCLQLCRPELFWSEIRLPMGKFLRIYSSP